MAISTSTFGEYNGKQVNRYTLTNSKGNSVCIINYGATVISWNIQAGENDHRNIVTGFDELGSYLCNDVYMGCIAGRYANRIAKGRFSIQDKTYQLACNNGDNHLHGGVAGFDKVFWDAVIMEADVSVLALTYVSRDGEEGYPGKLTVTVSYSYTDTDELRISYQASTDMATVVNLTNHCYFNLTGDVGQAITAHSLQINAAYITAVDAGQIPTGELTAVEETPFDFNIAKKISRDIAGTGNGYDHNFVLNSGDHELALVAVLTDPGDTLSMQVYTTEPGLQLYTGNLLNGSLTNRDGKSIGMHAALCLETQHFPDSPNHPDFPATVLQPGEIFTSETIYAIASTAK